MAELVSWALEPEPEPVVDGAAAIRLLHSDPAIQIAILDREMPVLDGVKVLAQLRKTGTFVYGLMLTGRTGDREFAQAFESGADDFLAKPARAIELRVRLEAGRRITESQAQLCQAWKLESVGRLAAGIAHEIDTPAQYLGDTLVVNAAQAIEEARIDDSLGSTRIRTARDGEGSARIDVTDSGSGVPNEIRDRIFAPFFTTKEVGQGTGQGLAVACSAIVDKPGGTLDLEPAAGGGTTFTIRLPIEGDAGQLATPGRPAETPARRISRPGSRAASVGGRRGEGSNVGRSSEDGRARRRPKPPRSPSRSRRKIQVRMAPGREAEGFGSRAHDTRE